MSTSDQPQKREHLLITLFGKDPEDTIAMIQERFPYIDVQFYAVDATDNFVDIASLSDMVPNEVWQKATMLVTVFALPKSEELCPNLKYIHLFSAGIDHFASHPLLTTSNIPITTSTGITAAPIGEYIVMSLLALTNRLPLQLTWQKQHHWGSKPPFLTSMGDWVGKTVGIAGYGSIGRHAARILVAMGARVFAYTARPRHTAEERRDTQYRVPGTGDPDGVYPERWFSGTSRADLHAFLGSGLHALVVCLPLTPQTKGVMGHDEFQTLYRTSPFPPSNFDHQINKSAIASLSSTSPSPSPAGAFIINISRGAIIDNDALIEALTNRTVRAAALDVTDPEPLPQESKLWDMDNCIVTPHTSGLGSEYKDRGFRVLMENLERREKGEEMWNVVRRGRGY